MKKAMGATRRRSLLNSMAILSDEEWEFANAIDQYKRQNNRPNPGWAEVLAIARALGYRKIAMPTPQPSRKEGIQ